MEDLRKLNCSKNVYEETNEYSKLECYKALSDDDIVPRVICGSEETRNFKKML